MKTYRVSIRQFCATPQRKTYDPITRYTYVQAESVIEARQVMIRTGFSGRIIAIEHTPKIGE